MFNQRWFRALFRRRFAFILILALKLGLLVYVIVSSSLESRVITVILELFSLIVALALMVKPDIPAYKTLWIFLVLVSPILGGAIYLFFNHQLSSKLWRKKIEQAEKKGREARLEINGSLADAERDIPGRARDMRYLQSSAGFPIYSHTETKYLSPGEEKLKELLSELEKAEKYIFIEYFIIEEGEMWNSILEILKRKSAEGVRVRVLYDDFGCFMLLPKNYSRTLKDYGIEAAVFNPFVPFLTSMQNNRDHRKILSIDGRVAFTGGINLADEYINKKERFGHWKDSSLMMTGDAAWSLTAIFLEMWEIATGKTESFSEFLPPHCKRLSQGYVQPYADSPTDTERVSTAVYLRIIESAKEYVYINTPYLILDESFVFALTLAAKSGVDIRIVTPHIPDKKFVHETTRSYYSELISAGVRIYEYTPGFIHSKTFVSDDEVATVGTANLDYRSLYLHFECGAVIYSSPTVTELKKDFLRTLTECHEITPEEADCSLPRKLRRNFLRVFAPLM